MTTPIVVNPESEADAAVWALTREVASLFASLPWILIGGQMVAIHEAEHGLRPLRSTVDVDALVDVRTLSTATPGRRAASPGRLVRCAARCRWSCLSVRPRSGRRGRAGARPPRPTCGPSDGAAGNDSRALGGRQALNRRRTVLVDAGDGAFTRANPNAGRSHRHQGSGDRGRSAAREAPAGSGTTSGAGRRPRRDTTRTQPERALLPAVAHRATQSPTSRVARHTSRCGRHRGAGDFGRVAPRRSRLFPCTEMGVRYPSSLSDGVPARAIPVVDFLSII